MSYFKKTNPTKPALPNVIGAIDCMHVRIPAKGVPNREIFRNRHQEMSFNVQAVCDANLLFTDVVVRWPGSTHDSRIFKNSKIYSKVLKGQHFGYWLVGDGGYGLRPFLLPPIKPDKVVTQAQERYKFPQVLRSLQSTIR